MQQTTKIFPLALTYPQFFNHHLNDPNRIIKIFQGKNCASRAFYYQLLKIVFELETHRDGKQLDYSQIVITRLQELQPQLQPLPNSKPLQQQISKIINFISQLHRIQQLHFQQYFDEDISLDEAFLSIIQSILEQANLTHKSVEDILIYLGNYFNERITKIQRCIKFQQSDVFVYVENQQELYLVFLKFEEEQESQTNSLDKISLKSQKQTKSGKNIIKNQNDTIIDILHSNKNVGQLRNMQNIHTSPQIIKKNIDGQLYYQNNINPPQQIQKNERDQPFENDYKTNEQNRFERNIQNTQNYQSYRYSSSELRNNSPDNFHSEELIYRPSVKNITLKTISEASASKQSILQSQRAKKDPLDWANEEEKGTFYQQFTNTRILNILPEPQRTTVKMLKNRFIGIHSNHLYHHT